MNAAKTEITSRQLFAIAGVCLRRVWDHLPDQLREATENLERGESPDPMPGPETVRYGVETHTEFIATVSRWLNEFSQGSLATLLRIVPRLAGACCGFVSYLMFPAREWISFSLPPELEVQRATLATFTTNRLGHLTLSTHAEDDPVRIAAEYLNVEMKKYSQQRWNASTAEDAHLCDPIRDILGYPEVTVVLDPLWRTSTVVAMAKGMIESRDFSAMPILADALQDAGCEDPEILEHCRREKPHVRGCWVLDRMLNAGE